MRNTVWQDRRGSTEPEQALTIRQGAIGVNWRLDDAVVYGSRGDVFMAAVADLLEGLKQWQLWSALAWQDIKQRYRRSVLGPFWLTISMGVMITTLGFLYSVLFRTTVKEYLPFITLGLLCWGFISGLVIDACAAMTSAEAIIKHLKLPLTVHVLRSVFRNVLIFGHNFVVYVVIAPIFDISPGFYGFMAVLGMILIILNGFWVTLILSIVCARYRDIAQIVSSLLQVIFFLSPIIWYPRMIGERPLIVNGNPVYHFVELVRGPLLGQAPSTVSWVVAIVITVCGLAAALLVLARFRSRLVYWL